MILDNYANYFHKKRAERHVDQYIQILYDCGLYFIRFACTARFTKQSGVRNCDKSFIRA